MAGLDSMLAALPGRTTDAVARWKDTTVSFGWRDRAAEEGSEAQHPRRGAAAGGLAIAASARLDGRNTLRKSLGIPGRDEAGLPDHVLVLRSYARWGRACPEHLLGDYAFALWDEKREVLFCARDHIGTRPFYYALAGERFVFASDIDAVLAAPGIPDDLDEVAVATRLTCGQRDLGDRTCYRAIRRLLPGHTLSVQRGAVRVHRWWRPEEVQALPAASDDAVAEECREILTEAVRDRVRGRRAIGVHLSGGLDSSAVAVLATRELRRLERPAPLAFSWHPPPCPDRGSVETEAEYGAIESVCRQENLQVLYRPPEARDVIAFLRRDATRGGAEAGMGMLLHEEVVQRAAAEQGVEVLLSGFGGDEGISFNGRGHYPQLLRRGRVGTLWRELQQRSRNPLAALVAEAVLPLVFPGAEAAVRRLRQGQWPFRKNLTFIHPEFSRRVRPLPARGGPPPSDFRGRQVLPLRSERLFRRLDRWATSGARYGIEYRYPLLDRRVLEFALSLPPEQYRRGRWSRWLMRRTLDAVLPPEVCWNPSKRDPVRVERFLDACEEALPTVRRMIEERGELPRSRYLDLPRLLEHMDPERWRTRGRRAPVLNALRFLDF